MEAKIIYIAGYGRSGSTILDLILNSNEQIIGLGEIANLFKEEFRESLSPFWKNVVDKTLEYMKIDIDQAHYLTRQADKGNVKNVSLVEYKKLWETIFSLLEESIGEDIWFVDSSKTSNESYNRAKLLQEMGCKVKIIHLIRNPFEVIASVRKGSNRKLERNETIQNHIFSDFKTFLSWIQTNLRVKFIYSKDNGYEKIIVSYSDIRNDFLLNINNISMFLDFEFDIGYIKNENLIPRIDYGVSGNRVRRNKAVKLSFSNPHPNLLKRKMGDLLIKLVT